MTTTFTAPYANDFSAINVHTLRKMAPEWGIKGAGKMSVSELRGYFNAEQERRNQMAQAVHVAEQARITLEAANAKITPVKEPKVKAPKAAPASALHRPAKGEKAAWDNKTMRLSEEAKAVAKARITEVLITGDGLFTADIAAILGMKEGSVYGRIKTQEANGRIVGTLVNPEQRDGKPGERGAGARGQHGLKLIWQVAGATDEGGAELVKAFVDAIVK